MRARTILFAIAILSLDQNFPNLFNPSTTIRYGLPNRSQVRLTVFNTLEQEVSELVQGERDAGYHGVKFDAQNLPSGVYFCRLQVRSVLREAEEESRALRRSRRADPLDSAVGRDSRDGAGNYTETQKLVVVR